MTLVTRGTRAARKFSLTRTRAETLVWSVRAAAAYRPATRAPRRRSSPTRRRLTLTRTPQETFRWMLRGSPWGALVIIGAIIAVLAAAVALWLLVPAIDTVVAAGRAALEDGVNWLIKALGAFPDWLASQF